MQQQAFIERKPIWYSYWAILLCLMVVGLGFLGYRYVLTINSGRAFFGYHGSGT